METERYDDNANHCFLRSGVDRIVRTMRAPLIGGLEYIGRIRIFICDIARCASSGDEQTNENAPTRSPDHRQIKNIARSMWSRITTNTTASGIHCSVNGQSPWCK